MFDAHIGAWVYLDILGDISEPKKYHLYQKARRSGFYPYEYNFLFGRRDGIVQCSYCGEFLPTKKISRDHVYPKSRGGQLTTPACYRCNETKADMLPIEWALKINNIEENIDAAVA